MNTMNTMTIVTNNRKKFTMNDSERVLTMSDKKSGPSHDAINPALIAALTGQQLFKVNPKPSITMLPGKWVDKFAKSKDLFRDGRVPNLHSIHCRACDYPDQYDLGTVFIDDKKWIAGVSKIDAEDIDAMKMLFLDCLSFSLYFRCSNCNSAEGWNLDATPHFKQFLEIVNQPQQDEEAQYCIGKMKLTDGTFLRSPTDFEAYYLYKLQDEPRNGQLWYRLGNVYIHGGRPELAWVALERSISVDRCQTEAYCAIGYMMLRIGEVEMAARLLHTALISAHENVLIDPMSLREVLHTVILGLIIVHSNSNHKIPLLPTAKEYRNYFSELNKYKLFMHYIEQFESIILSSDDHDTHLRMAEMFMWKRAWDLPDQERKLKLTSNEVNLAPADVKEFVLETTRLHSGLGSVQRPIIVKVTTDVHLTQIAKLCARFGWIYVISIETVENLNDLKKALKEKTEQTNPYESCLCGSGEKFKFCCEKRLRNLHGVGIVDYYEGLGNKTN